MSQTFAVMDVNPNVGHGCLCSEIGTQDSHGPFVVFSATELDTIESPFPVLCAGCVFKAAELMAAETQPPELRQVAADDNETVLPKPRKKMRTYASRELEDGPSI